MERGRLLPPAGGTACFGDYFKREAIDWVWELVVTVCKFPPQRLYATIYSPDKSKHDPGVSL